MQETPMLTRRQATIATLALAGTIAAPAAAATLTASAIVERIRKHLAATWRDSAVDGFAAGDPDVQIHGIALAAVPNMATLRKAVAQGCNLIISPESPLYARPIVPSSTPGPFDPAQAVAQLRSDPTYAAKLAYIAQHKLAIYRLDENLRAPHPSLLLQGIAQGLGWQKHRDPANEQIFAVPRTTLGSLVTLARRRLGVNGGMRVIGQSTMPVRRVLVVPGRIDPVAVVKLLPQVDALLTGDLREWELVEYFHDSWETSAPKALIAVGRILSEQPGILAAASWLGPVAGVPVKPILLPDPYWRLPQ